MRGDAGRCGEILRAELSRRRASTASVSLRCRESDSCLKKETQREKRNVCGEYAAAKGPRACVLSTPASGREDGVVCSVLRAPPREYNGEEYSEYRRMHRRTVEYVSFEYRVSTTERKTVNTAEHG